MSSAWTERHRVRCRRRRTDSIQAMLEDGSTGRVVAAGSGSVEALAKNWRRGRKIGWAAELYTPCPPRRQCFRHTARGQGVHNSALGESVDKTSRDESGSMKMNSGFHLKSAAKLSNDWGPPLNKAAHHYISRRLASGRSQTSSSFSMRAPMAVLLPMTVRQCWTIFLRIPSFGPLARGTKDSCNG